MLRPGRRSSTACLAHRPWFVRKGLAKIRVGTERRHMHDMRDVRHRARPRRRPHVRPRHASRIKSLLRALLRQDADKIDGRFRTTQRVGDRTSDSAGSPEPRGSDRPARSSAGWNAISGRRVATRTRQPRRALAPARRVAQRNPDPPNTVTSLPLLTRSIRHCKPHVPLARGRRGALGFLRHLQQPCIERHPGCASASAPQAH